MPETVTCPACSRTLRIPDNLAGKQVKCPGCGVPFIPAVNSVLPIDLELEVVLPDHRRDDELPQRKRPAGARQEAFKRVRLGIMLVLISNYVFLGQSVLSLLLGGMLLLSFGAVSSLSMISLVVHTICIIAVMLLTVLGMALNLYVRSSKREEGRTLSILAFVFSAVSTFMLLVPLFGTMFLGFRAAEGYVPIGRGAAMAGFALVGLVLHLVWFIVWLFFLRSLCRIIRRDELSDYVSDHAFRWITTLVGVPIITLLFFFCGGFFATIGAGPIVGILGLVLGFGYIVLAGWVLTLFILYIILLHRVSGAVQSYIRRM